MIKWVLTLAIFMFSANAANAKIYLVAKYKVKGTTYTQVVFFYDPDVPSLAACEKERQLGHSGRWRYYRHIVRRGSGISFSGNYFCVDSALSVENWTDTDPYNYIYLVDLREEGKVAVQGAETYAACLKKLKQTQPEESYTFFCATANQKID